MKKRGYIFIFLVSLLFVSGCFEQKPTIKQGIYGKVILVQGSCEPGSYSMWKGCTETTPLSVDIYIRELATKDHMSDLIISIIDPSTKEMKMIVNESARVNFFGGRKTNYLENKTKLVKKVKSNEKGFYEAELPSGVYSVFIEYEGNEICSNINEYDKACLVIVKEDIKEYNPIEWKVIAY